MLSAPEPPGARVLGRLDRPQGGNLNHRQRRISGVTTHLGSVFMQPLAACTGGGGGGGATHIALWYREGR